MMFTGTTQQQDTRFSDKEKKLMKQMKFGDCLNKRVDMSKVKLDVLRPWIGKKITDILHIEDDVVVEFVYNQLEEEKYPCPKKMQINLTGFLNGRNARQFMGELWSLLLSAQDSGSGIPVEFIQNKKEEILKREVSSNLQLNDLLQYNENSSGKRKSVNNNNDYRKSNNHNKFEMETENFTVNTNLKKHYLDVNELEKDNEKMDTRNFFFVPSSTGKDVLKSPADKNTTAICEDTNIHSASPKKNVPELSEIFEAALREHNQKFSTEEKYSRNLSITKNRRSKTRFRCRTQSKSPSRRYKRSECELWSDSQRSFSRSSMNGHNIEEQRAKVAAKELSADDKICTYNQTTNSQNSINEKKGVLDSENHLRKAIGRKSSQMKSSPFLNERSSRSTKHLTRHMSSSSNSPERKNDKFEIRKNTNSIQLKRHYRNNRYSSTSSIEMDVTRYRTEPKRKDNDSIRQFNERRNYKSKRLHNWQSTGIRRRSRSLELYSRSPRRRSRSPRRLKSPLAYRGHVKHKQDRHAKLLQGNISRDSRAIERNRRSSVRHRHFKNFDDDRCFSPSQSIRNTHSPKNMLSFECRKDNKRKHSVEKNNVQDSLKNTSAVGEVHCKYEQCNSTQKESAVSFKSLTIEKAKISKGFENASIKTNLKSELLSKSKNKWDTSIPSKKFPQRYIQDKMSSNNIEKTCSNSEVINIGSKNKGIIEELGKHNYFLGTAKDKTSTSGKANKGTLSRTPSPFLKLYERETDVNAKQVQKIPNIICKNKQNRLFKNNENEDNNGNTKSTLLEKNMTNNSKTFELVSAIKKVQHSDNNSKNKRDIKEHPLKVKPPSNLPNVNLSKYHVHTQFFPVGEILPDADNFGPNKKVTNNLTENDTNEYEKKKKMEKKKNIDEIVYVSDADSYDKKKKYRKLKKHGKRNKKEKRVKRKLRKSKTIFKNENSDNDITYDYFFKKPQTVEPNIIFDGINDDLEKKLRERALKSMKKTSQ